MRIGIVCEGQTDFIAIERLVGLSFRARDIDVSFVSLQPPVDNTRAGAGWPQVLRWIEKNPIGQRNVQHFGRGLFAKDLSAKRCDAILFQMDTDIIGEQSFENKVRNDGYAAATPSEPRQRAVFIADVLAHYLDYSNLDSTLQRKHFLFPAVESTETWCIAAADNFEQDPETFGLADLVHHFGCLVSDVCGQPRRDSYTKINKRQILRRKVCESLTDVGLLEAQCAQYSEYLGIALDKSQEI
ncbi:hypothetical protein [Phaeobacter inhibens]|uniref:hypothetical protein n=1 Tax=Phaeobacter inhibens TaxID=221822 RepID=UPI0001632C81|nr:hypothetical protein [Phaeobacter inhibens]AFO91545.1 hypothetical protein PGA1_c18480 [Phaeobacter inhibens DSM 17395]AUQ46212.1 hypothetical protein PhaeoP10_01874 [Phaeobacter inhibens]